MDEEKNKTKTKIVPDICTFDGLKKVVMTKVAEKKRELQESGKKLTRDEFRKLLRDTWEEAKKEKSKVCNISNEKKTSIEENEELEEDDGKVAEEKLVDVNHPLKKVEESKAENHPEDKKLERKHVET